MSEQNKLMTFWQIRQMPSASVKKARIMAAQMEMTLPNVLAHAIDALEREQRFAELQRQVKMRPSLRTDEGSTMWSD